MHGLDLTVEKERTYSGARARPRPGTARLQGLAILSLLAGALILLAPDNTFPSLPNIRHYYQKRGSDVTVVLEAVGTGRELLSRYRQNFQVMNSARADSIHVIRYIPRGCEDEECVLYYIGSIRNDQVTVLEYVVSTLEDFNKNFTLASQLASRSGDETNAPQKREDREN